MNRLAYRSAAAAAATLIVAVAGCGATGTSTPAASKPAASGSSAASHPTASPATNGLEHQTAAQVAQAAHAAFQAATSVHTHGTFYTDRRTETFDLRYEGDSARGTFTVNGATIQIITVGDKAYLKADKRGWKAMGNPDTRGLPVNTWVSAGSAGQMLTPFSRESLASELTAEQAAHGGAGTVTQSTLAGQKVVVVSYPDGSKLYVANTGTPYPLRFHDTGAVGSRDFSEYGAALHITAPPNPV
jgi:hypothetical protein